MFTTYDWELNWTFFNLLACQKISLLNECAWAHHFAEQTKWVPYKGLFKFRNMKRRYTETDILQKSLAKAIFGLQFCYWNSLCLIAQALSFGRENFDPHIYIYTHTNIFYFFLHCSCSLSLSEYHTSYAGYLAILSKASPKARKWQVTSGCGSPHAPLLLGGGTCWNQLRLRYVISICDQSEEDKRWAKWKGHEKYTPTAACHV